MTIGQNALKKLIQGIIQEVQPLRIILFGSAVINGVDQAGDLDVLVVMPNDTDCRSVAKQLYKSLKNIGKPFDLVVSTPQTLDRHRENPGLVYKSILDSGKELYAA